MLDVTRTVTCKSGQLEGLSLGTVSGGLICQISELNFQWVLH